MALTPKQRMQLDAALAAFRSGEIGNLRSDSKRWTKGDVLLAGTRILQKHKEVEREKRISEVLATRPHNFHILTHDSELPAFVDRLRTECKRQMTEWAGKFDFLGVKSMTAGDFEGTGVDSYIDLSIGFSIWLPLQDEGYYLPYGHVDMRGVEGFEFLNDTFAFKIGDPQLTRSNVLDAIKPYLSQPIHGKTFHMGSARYDLHVARNDGYEIRGCVWDTLDAMHLLNEHEEKYGLKKLVEKYGKYFGIPGPIYTFEDMFGNGSPAPFSVDLVGIYAIKDVLYGWKLCEWQMEMMRKSPGRLLDCYANIDSKLPEVDVFMARCGFAIDLDGLKALETEFIPALEQAKRDVIETYGIDDEFVRKMDRTLSTKKIEKWIEAQKARIKRWDDSVKKHQKIIEECEAAGKTNLIKYRKAKERLEELHEKKPAPAEVEHAPRYVTEFEITNNNHIAYLIYDHLGIEDVTPKFYRGKERSTASDVMEEYYEEETALKPLATVAAYEKLLNTYIRKIPHALEANGRLHSEFKAGGTRTGRYSSSGYKGRPTDILDEFIGGDAD